MLHFSEEKTKTFLYFEIMYRFSFWEVKEEVDRYIGKRFFLLFRSNKATSRKNHNILSKENSTKWFESLFTILAVEREAKGRVSFEFCFLKFEIFPGHNV